MTRPYFPLSGHWGLTRLSTGQPFFVDTRCRDITPWLLLGGVWETFVDDVLSALARPGDTFVDVGANVGYYTVKIGGRLGPEGRAFAFEANPEMFEILTENININGMAERAKAFNVGAGDRPGVLRLTVDAHHPGSGCLWLDDEPLHPSASILNVPMQPLTAALPHDTRVDLLKIDVEGHEPAVLAGAADVLRRSPDAAIVTEVAANRWSRFGEPSALLRGYADGRRLFRIFTDGRLEEMHGDRLTDWLEGDFVSYVLMLPDTEARLAQIARFLPGYVEAEPPAPIVEAPQRALGRGLLQRARRRAGRFLDRGPASA